MAGVVAAKTAMRVAVQGCCHGRLSEIYDRVLQLDKRDGKTTDLLLICGDFQAVRNLADLACMACPDKYKKMNTFHDYYAGRSHAPVLTIFIGGNHEASNYLQELFYGGWVAPNMYYLGCAGVVNVGGLRIGGISGIYQEHRYNGNEPRGEYPPYNRSSQRSVYHIRPLQALQFFLLSQNKKMDVFMSHDWPRGIVAFGDKESLLRKKKFLRKEVEENSLGSVPAEQILHQTKPRFWFSGHMHVKFEAKVPHDGDGDGGGGGGANESTHFLALDKCLPGRDFLQVFDIEPPEPVQKPSEPLRIEYDAEWLSIIRATHCFVAAPPSDVPHPSFFRDKLEVHANAVQTAFKDIGFGIAPAWFAKTAPEHPAGPERRNVRFQMPRQSGNPQTDFLLDRLGLDHIPPITIPFALHEHVRPPAPLHPPTPPLERAKLDHDENEIDI